MGQGVGDEKGMKKVGKFRIKHKCKLAKWPIALSPKWAKGVEEKLKEDGLPFDKAECSICHEVAFRPQIAPCNCHHDHELASGLQMEQGA